MGMMKFPTEWKVIKFMCQTTNQSSFCWHIRVLFSSENHMAMDQYLYIPFLGGYSHPFTSYFDVNYRGTIGFDPSPYVNIGVPG